MNILRCDLNKICVKKIIYKKMFRYAEFWKLLTSGSVGRSAPDVFVVGYRADYPIAKKYDKHGRQSSFLTLGMQARRLDVASFDPLVHARPDEYRHGAYLVFRDNGRNGEKQEANLRTKDLFVVDVQEKTVPIDLEGREDNATKIHVADHFTFVVQPNDRMEKKLHFHRTEYLPYAPERGRSDRRDSYLPLQFDCPVDVPRCLTPKLDPELRKHSMWIHDILTRHLNAANLLTSTGGSRRKKRDGTSTLRRSNSFDDIWRNLPVHSMFIFAVATDDTSVHHVTVFLRIRNAPSVLMQHAFHFCMSERPDERVLQSRIVELMKDMAWTELLPRDL